MFLTCSVAGAAMLDHPSFWSGKLALRPRPYSRADSPIFRLYDGFKFSVFQRELLQEAAPNYEIEIWLFLPAPMPPIRRTAALKQQTSSHHITEFAMRGSKKQHDCPIDRTVKTLKLRDDPFRTSVDLGLHLLKIERRPISVVVHHFAVAHRQNDIRAVARKHNVVDRRCHRRPLRT